MSNESGIRLDYPIQVRGGDGSTLWEGLGILSNVVEGVNTGAATISPGHVISWDTTNLIMQAPDRAASVATQPQKRALRLANTTGVYTYVAGVALNTAAVGERVMVGGQGSVCPVRCTGTSTTNVNLIVSATDGVATQQSAVAGTSVGQVGKSIKPAGTTGGATDSGSASYVIGLINPY